MTRDVYSGRLKLNGEEHENTLRAATNCARSPSPRRFEEAKSLTRKMMPVARRVLGIRIAFHAHDEVDVTRCRS